MSQKTLIPEQRYDMLHELAKGSASTIYLVHDRFLLRDVAMKVLHPLALEYPEEVRRFREEAQITAQLEHPNIVPVYTWQEDSDVLPSFSMKYVRGGTLRDKLQEKAYDPGSEVDLYRFLQIFLKVCDALSFAHNKGVIHRDLKPENIMVGGHGQVYLMDWGVLRLVRPSQIETSTPTPSTQTEQEAWQINIERDPSLHELDQPGRVLGSLFYLSPEQALGEMDKINERTDVFALGAILYEILTQSPPYFAWSIEEFLEKARTCDIVPPQEKTPEVHLPAELCRIAMRAMAREQSDRYPSVDALKQDLERFLQGGGRFDRQVFAPGEVIVHEGEEGTVAYLIVRGYCEVYKTVDGQKISVGQMGPGDVFGETAVFASGVRTASVAAIDEVTLKVIDRETLEQEVGFDSWISSLIRTLASRFMHVDQRATQHQQALLASSFLNHLLLYLNLHGQSIQKENSEAEADQSSRYLQTSWSTAQRDLCQQLSCSPEELRFQLEQLRGVSWTQDILTVDLTTLAQSLTPASPSAAP